MSAEIRLTPIGSIDGIAWLTIEEGASRFSVKLDSKELTDLGHSIVYALKQHAEFKINVADSFNAKLTKRVQGQRQMRLKELSEDFLEGEMVEHLKQEPILGQ